MSDEYSKSKTNDYKSHHKSSVVTTVTKDIKKESQVKDIRDGSLVQVNFGESEVSIEEDNGDYDSDEFESPAKNERASNVIPAKSPLKTLNPADLNAYEDRMLTTKKKTMN